MVGKPYFIGYFYTLVFVVDEKRGIVISKETPYKRLVRTTIHVGLSAAVVASVGLMAGCGVKGSATNPPKTDDAPAAITQQVSGTVNTAPNENSANLDENGLGTKFTFSRVADRTYDASQIDLTPNANTAVDTKSDKVIYNGIQFNFDTESGATPRHVRTENEILPDQDIKNSKMMWTVQPPLGIVTGELYRKEKEFAGGYIGTTDFVINNGKIVHVEMNEKGPDDYYEKYWAGQTKRRSGYGFFQATSPRTNETLMVTPNAFNFLEWQLLKHNSVNIPLQGVRGISNSARDAFIPEIQELRDDIKNPSGKFYASIALPVEQGVTARLEAVIEGGKIVEARYDEIMADEKEDVANESLKPYYRQSKLESVEYNLESNDRFRTFEKGLVDAIVSQNKVDAEVSGDVSAEPEYANAKMLGEKLASVVEDIKANGIPHNIGTIADEKKLDAVTPIYYRTDDLTVHYKSAKWNPEQKSLMVTAVIQNNDSKPVQVFTDWFFLYVKNADDKYESIGDPAKSSFNMDANSAQEVTFTFGPIQETDHALTFKYDGPNKIYEEMPELADLK